jgi:glycosyltransferase involved in cell wall biosynthesis
VVSVRIAFVSDRVYPFFKGGAEKLMWESAVFLAKNKHTVTYLTGIWPGMKKEQIIDGVIIIGVYKVRKFYTTIGRKSILESIKYSFAIVKYLLLNHFDIIHCDQFPVIHLPLVILLANYKKSKTFITWHEYWGLYWFQYIGLAGLIGYLLEKTIPKLVTRNIAVSPPVYREFRKICSDRIKFLPPGLNSINISKSKIKKYELIYFGRLISHKNVDILVLLAKLLPSDWTIVLIGDGPMMKNLQKMIEDLPTNSAKVLLMGSKNNNDLALILSQSMVYTSFSQREGFGISFLEALAADVPILVYDHPLNEGVKIAKWFCPEMTFTVENLDNLELIAEMIIRIKQKNFSPCKKVRALSWEIMTKKLQELYERSLQL